MPVKKREEEEEVEDNSISLVKKKYEKAVRWGGFFVDHCIGSSCMVQVLTCPNVFLVVNCGFTH